MRLLLFKFGLNVLFQSYDERLRYFSFIISLSKRKQFADLIRLYKIIRDKLGTTYCLTKIYINVSNKHNL